MNMSKYNNPTGKNDRSPMKELQYVLETRDKVKALKIMELEEEIHFDKDRINGIEYSMRVERSIYDKGWLITLVKLGEFTEKERQLLETYLSEQNYNFRVLSDMVFVSLNRPEDITPRTLQNEDDNATYKTMAYARMVVYSMFYSLDTLNIESPDPITYWANPNIDRN